MTGTQVNDSLARRHGRAWGKKRETMIWTVAAVLLLLWALGVVSSATMGGFIHLFLVTAVVIVLVRIINGPRTLTRA
jgi:hypothetical protein